MASKRAADDVASDSDEERPLGYVVAKLETVPRALAASGGPADESETELLDTDDDEEAPARFEKQRGHRLTKNTKHTKRLKSPNTAHCAPDPLFDAIAVLNAEDARDSKRCKEIKRRWCFLFEDVARILTNIETALAAPDLEDASDGLKQQYDVLKQQVDQLSEAVIGAEEERPKGHFMKRFANDKCFSVSALFDALIDRKEKVSKEIGALGN